MVMGRGVIYLQILPHFSALCVAPLVLVSRIFLLLYFYIYFLVFTFFFGVLQFPFIPFICRLISHTLKTLLLLLIDTVYIHMAV